MLRAPGEPSSCSLPHERATTTSSARPPPCGFAVAVVHVHGPMSSTRSVHSSGGSAGGHGFPVGVRLGLHQTLLQTGVSPESGAVLLHASEQDALLSVARAAGKGKLTVSVPAGMQLSVGHFLAWCVALEPWWRPSRPNASQ